MPRFPLQDASARALSVPAERAGFTARRRVAAALATLASATLAFTAFAAPAASAASAAPASILVKAEYDEDGNWIDPVLQNTVAPSLKGTATTGAKMRVLEGTWENADTFSVKWFINDVEQDTQWYDDSWYSSDELEGFFTVPASAVGKRLRAEVTAENWSATAPLTVSTESQTVRAATFATAPAPRVTGTAAVGATLRATAGTWSGNPSLSYQWLRNARPIAGARASSYKPTSADRGHKISVRVTGSKTGYVTLTRVSVAYTVRYGTLTPSKKPALSATPRYGSTVSVKSTWPAGTKLSYAWYLSGKRIAGAKYASYKPGASAIGRSLKASVTAKRAGYATKTLATPAKRVVAATFAVKRNPSFTGSARSGALLTAKRPTLSPSATSYSYRWYRGSKPISGATGSSYRVKTADQGHKISVRVTAKRAGYTSKTLASGSKTIYKPARTVLRGDGTYRVGRDIKPGLYKAPGSSTNCYWARLSGFSGGLDDIEANHFGHANTYVRILPGDRGFETRNCGKWTTVSTSGANASTVTKNGTYRIGIDIKPGTYVGRSTGSSCYWEILWDFTGDFDDLEDNYFGSANTVVDVPSYAAGVRFNNCGTLRR